MFYGRFKIRVLSETLRAFAAGRIVGPYETGPGGGTPDDSSPPPRPGIHDLPELEMLFRDVFVAPNALACMNSLDEAGRNYWADIVTAYEKGRFRQAREMADAFASWLDGTYQNSERLQFDDPSFSVLLDGELYTRLEPEGYALLKLLWGHKNTGAYVSAGEIIDAFDVLGSDPSKGLTCVKGFPGGAAGLKRLVRAVKALDPPLRRLIQSKPGRGRRLCLDPA